MPATVNQQATEEVKSITVSSEKVKDMIETILNKDLDAKIDLLNADEVVKNYRRYRLQLAKQEVTETDGEGKKITREVDVFDEEGKQVFVTRLDKDDPKKKKKISVPAKKTLVVKHKMTDEEKEERLTYLENHKAHYKTVTKEAGAYNEHRTSVSKRGVGYFNEFLKSTAVSLLVKAGQFVDEKNTATTAKTGARLPEKPKITMTDLAVCDYMSVPGIKVFITPTFGSSLSKALEERDVERQEAIAKEIKKNLKLQGYVKNDTLKRQEAAKKKKEKSEKERADLAKFAGKTYEEILAIKEQEKKEKAAARKKARTPEEEAAAKKDKEDKKKNEPKVIFANAIKRAFKEETKKEDGKSRYSVSSTVLEFFEEACKAACIEVANAAHFYCKREDTTVYNTDEMIHHIGILHGGSISVSTEFSSRLKSVPSADAVEELRAANKKRRDNGEVVANIDKDVLATLPTEDVVHVDAVFRYGGEGAEYFIELMAKDDLFKANRKKENDEKKRLKAAKAASDGSAEVQKAPSSSEDDEDDEEYVPPPKKVLPKKKKAVEVVEEDEEEEQQVVKPKKK